MVTTAPRKPFIFINLYLEQGTRSYAQKSLTFQEVAFTKRVIEYGSIERSIPFPPGLLQTGDARVVLEDVDNQIREWFDDATPLRRLGDITFEFEEHKDDPPDFDPDYTGEIVDFSFPAGKAIIILRDTTALWLARPIPNLLIRDNFPDMPPYLELGFIPIIFGNVASYSAVNVEPQGVINCIECDTILHRFAVARHRCRAVTAVYRKRKGENYFDPVSPSEYSIVQEDRTINGVSYTLTYIQFTIAQPAETIIHADVEGMDFRWNFDLGVRQNLGYATRNPVDSLVNLIYYLLIDEVNIQRFDGDSFTETGQRSDDKNYYCDGAITESLTAGVAISRLAADFNIDFFQDNHAKIKVHMYDAELDAVAMTDLNDSHTLKQTLEPAKNPKIINRFRYRLFRQNAGLTEYVLHSATGQWGLEYVADYTKDQSELAASGENPIIEGDPIELFFIRDSNVAFNVVKRRMGYHTLRSYICAFNLSGAAFKDIDVAQLISLTHPQGVGLAGWTDKVLKVYLTNLNLQSWLLNIETVCIQPISDADISLNGAPPAAGAQIHFPYLHVLVNGSGDTPGITDPSANPQMNLNDNYPAAPTSDFPVFGSDVKLIYDFTSRDGTTKTLPKARVSFANVNWQEDRTVTPRQVSGYVAMPSLEDYAQMFTGTLSPDERPTGLTDADIYKVLFYAEDFDHFFWWVGTSETGTASGWRCIDNRQGEVAFRINTPIPNSAWHLCDGSTDISTSDYKGDVTTITVPNMTGGTYPKGSATYTGPTPTAAIAPTQAAHHHSVVGLNTDLAGAITPTASWAETGNHTHSVALNLITTSNDGAHSHTAATGPHTSYDLTHHHGVGSLVNSNFDMAHDHGWASAGPGAFINSTSAVVSTGGVSTQAVSTAGDYVTDGGRTYDSKYTTGGHYGDDVGDHTHTISGNTGDSDIAIDAGGLAIDVPSDGSNHVHGFSGPVNTGVGTALTGTVSVSHIPDHFHAMLGVTSDATPTITATAEPLHMGLLPYLRL